MRYISFADKGIVRKRYLTPNSHAARVWTQRRSQLVKSRSLLRELEVVPVYLQCQKEQKVTQKNTASREAVAYQMPDLLPTPCIPIK